MANLLGQNIGTNYKGILNLNTLNGNLLGTLQEVTDGDGNASPLQLSTTQVNVGGGTALGRLVVRGDGTNPIARFEDNTGTYGINITQLSSLGTISWINGGSYLQSSSSVTNFYSAAARIDYLTWVAGSSYALSNTPVNNVNATSGTHGIISTSGVFAAGAGSANFRLKNIAYTINNSGAQTGTATGIFLNATETALNGMTHNLIDLQRGGVSQFLVDRAGALTTAGNINGQVIRSNSASTFSFNAADTGMFYFNSRGGLRAPSNGVFTLLNTAENDFGRLQFGGTTNAFPALKRSAAALDVRLADDSGFATINASSFTIGGTSTSLASNTLNLAGFNVMFYSSRIYIDNDNRGVAINNNLAIGNGNVATNSSSVLECISTTKGFLPPRMTTAQRDSIVTPATGLVIYNTTTNVLNFYNGAAWGAV